jgi:hypothetical protein
MYCLDQVVKPANIEECFLLPGKGCVGQVLGGRRRSDGDGNIPAGRHIVPGRAYLVHEAFGQFCTGYPVADSVPSLVQGVDVVDIEIL